MKNVIFQLLWFCFITFNWSNIERFNTKRWYKACMNTVTKFAVIWFYFFNLRNVWKTAHYLQELKNTLKILQARRGSQITWRNAKVLEHLSLCINCYTVCSPIFYIKKKVEGGWTFKRPGVMIYYQGAWLYSSWDLLKQVLCFPVFTQ